MEALFMFSSADLLNVNDKIADADGIGKKS